MEIGPEATTSGSHSDFVVVKFDPGGGDMKVATINTRSVNIHTTEPLIPDTDGDGGERADASTTSTTGDTTITYPVSIRVFEAPEPYPLKDEALRVVVAQPVSETTGWPLSPFIEAGG